MTLAIIKNKTVLDMPSLQNYVLMYIYDPSKMSLTQEKQMQESIVNWANHLRIRREIGFNAIDEENQFWLERLGLLLKQNESGELDNRKALFAEHEIDYRKFHRLPGAVTQADRIKANIAYEKTKKANPEDYK